jgi:putative iron-regulated protein
LLLLLVGSAHGSEPGVPSDLDALKRAVVSNYAAMVCANYADSVATAKQLKSAVDALVRQPSEERLGAARQAWLNSRVPYLQTEAFRFYDGPIDELEGFINAWPIDENYIDYVAGNPGAGIINATSKFPLLTRDLILAQNEKEGERNISTGFHAIEFLLWGQDTNSAGPGARSWTDYKRTKNAERRGQYLRITTDLLVEHLDKVAAAWTDGKRDNYRAELSSLDPDAALARILKGMGALSGPELAGERLTVAYETKEQEDEHSCFSDNTHNDVIYDAVGIQNVYLGHYKDVHGPGLYDLLTRVDAKFAEELKTQIETSIQCARNIPPPFDQAILGANGTPGRVAIKQTIQALLKESDMIAKAAKLLSIQLNL